MDVPSAGNLRVAAWHAMLVASVLKHAVVESVMMLELACVPSETEGRKITERSAGDYVR